jgi:CheY-like chemotaxis protein
MAGARACAFPLHHVGETMRPLPIKPLAGTPGFVCGVSVIRGTPTPVVDLKALLENSEHSPSFGRFVTLKDNPANMRLVERLIDRRTDIKLLKAVDGSLGIALAKSSLPDVILMDINLPGISGIDALKALREDAATAHIPVVAISANAMARDIEVGRKLGFFCYLTKPIAVEEFMTTLDLALQWNEKNAGSIQPPKKS